MTTQEANEYWQHESQRVRESCLPEPGHLIDSDWSLGWE